MTDRAEYESDKEDAAGERRMRRIPSQAEMALDFLQNFLEWHDTWMDSGVPNTWGFSHCSDEDDHRHHTYPDRPVLPENYAGLYHFTDGSVLSCDSQSYRWVALIWDRDRWRVKP